MEDTGEAATQEAEKPNIVLITMDTARAQNFGCYGYGRDTTPFMDSLAEDGTKVERCVSQCNWTLPSHAALLSGEYPHEIDCMTRNSRFDPEEPLAQKLSEKGYTTVGVTNVGFLHPQFGFDKGFDFYRNVTELVPFEKGDIWKDLKDREWGSTKEKYGYFLKDRLKALDLKELTNGAYYLLRNKLNFGDQGASETNREAKEQLQKREQPFFLFLNYLEPHSPYRPPREWRNRFEDISRRQALENEDYDELEALTGNPPSDQEMQTIQTLYDSEIAYLDSKIQNLYKWLEETGRLENTVFIVTSDHGEHFGEHGLYKHLGDLRQENIHVPLVIRDHRKQHQENHEKVTELRDLYQYILNGCQELPERETAKAVYTGLRSHYREQDLEGTETENYGNRTATVGTNHKTIFTETGKTELQLDEDFSEHETNKKGFEQAFNLQELEQNNSKVQNHEQQVKSKLKDLGYNKS